jgi:hypothetical protein
MKQGDCESAAFVRAVQQKSPIPIERLRVGNWIVPGLQDDAVEKAIEH